ncbi:MAG: glycosyl hydrolase family 18 protein [Cyclobacteriaceae bacterium]|nr:glycosyl hydrolase family 18 protein [Cyclobacteriaceae bacterium]
MLSCKSKPVSTSSDAFQPDTRFKVVGYLLAGNFGEIDSIELDRITHLCLAFANPDPAGNLVMDSEGDMEYVVKKAHKAGVKVLISLAGGGKPDKDIWKRVLGPDARDSFISSIMTFVETNNLDGVDVDIEWNLLPAIDTLYEPFVVGLGNALHAKSKIITTALDASRIHPAVTSASLAAYNFINIMAYDKTGPWRPDLPGQHSPFSFAESALKYWTIDLKMAPEKLVLGMPFYGYNFDPVGSKQYAEIVKMDVNNAYSNEFGQLYYNGIPEIVRKTVFARENCGGVMFWELSQDTYDDLSLLRAVDQTLKAGTCEVKLFFRDEDGDGFGTILKPYHACEAPKGYVVNSDDVDDSDRGMTLISISAEET